MWYVGLFGQAVVFGRDVDELKDKRTSGNNATSSRQKVSSNYILEYRGLSGGLRTNDNLCVDQ